ncbi:MAG: hypothetical protein Pg6C_19210 [Treponemataceae bacterium]|nr:MAG: hypothetical protein Pg6C_19210 [Treponemataceae bacterium]
MVKFKKGTQAAYDALTTKDAEALYFTTDTRRLFLGNIPIGEGEKSFDVVKYFGIDNSGAVKIILHGDTSTTNVIGYVGTDGKGYPVSGTASSDKKYTTYEIAADKITASTGQVYIFASCNWAAAGSLLTAAGATKPEDALRILDIQPKWNNIS